MDDEMQASIGAELEVGRRLDDYARARLTPSDAAKARARARVMREARLAFAGQAAAAARELAVEGTAHRRPGTRRGVALLLAATLSLGVVGGAMAASVPGGPLYGARIWLEDVTLPSDPTERAAAELTRLESRLAELEAAVRSGNRGAAEAALAAYRQIADEAIAGANASGDEAAIARLAAALDRHVDNLTRVAGQVPPQAAESINGNIQRAIERNDAAIERIESRGGTPPNGQGGQGSPGGPAVYPAATSAPAALPEPTPTPKPTKPPKPTTKPPTPTDPPADPPAGPPTEKPGNQPGGQGNEGNGQP
jgi:hypothetical protein